MSHLQRARVRVCVCACACVCVRVCVCVCVGAIHASETIAEDVAPERVCARWCAWVRVMACECKGVLGAAEDVERRRDVQVLQDRLVVVPERQGPFSFG